MNRDFGIYGKKQTPSLSTLRALLLTLPAVLFCWVLEYHFSANYPLHLTSSTPLWLRMTGWLPDRTSACLAGALLLFGMAALLQRASDYLIIFRYRTLLPLLLFLLLNSASFGFIPLRPASVAVFFLAPCMIELFKGYQQEETEGMAPGNACKVTFWLGVGSLVWIHLLWLLPLFWYGMYHFRQLTLRAIMASLLGIATVYWIVAGWCMWKHDFTELTDIVRLWTDFDVVPLREYLTLNRLASPAAAFVYTVILGIVFQFHKHHVGLRTRQLISFLLVSARYLLPFLFLFETETADFLCIFSLPVSLLMAYFFSGRSRSILLYYGLFLVCSLLLLTVHYA
ncbi:MAG: hypothetical protein LBJ01_06355 [Tannerella sp.]|jgi:hypothetical protein|nr:hypothetical protein [Tannerella sp.]